MNIGRENEQIEFKKTTAERREGIISIASILNKHKSGVLYFGVLDSGEVAGQMLGKMTTSEIARDIKLYVKPNPYFEITPLKTDDGKSFIEVKFQGTESPYSAYDVYYLRNDDRDEKISGDVLENLFRSRRMDYSKWENEESDETFENVIEETLKKYIEKGINAGRINYPYTSKNKILSKLGLIYRDSIMLNNAGKVMFSGNEPILLKTAVFATETKDTFIQLNHFSGNIYECINEASEFISKNISWKSVLNGGIERVDVPEIPLKAIREIIVNMFCHAKYDSNTSFEIDIFKNRVSFYNPGEFPIGYSPEDFANGTVEPIELNPKIIKTLFKTGIIDSFGSGFERAFNICNENGIKYEYFKTKLGFRFVFYRPLGQKDVHEMSKREKEVLNKLIENGIYTVKEIAIMIGVSDKTVSRAISKLKDLGLIVRVGSDYDGYWKVNE